MAPVAFEAERVSKAASRLRQDLGIAVQEKQRVACGEARRLIDGRQKADVLRVSHDDRAFGSAEQCAGPIRRSVVDDDDLNR